jgi:circadian clock protein KaiC
MAPGESWRTSSARWRKRDVKLIVIDSLNGYLNAMPEEQFLVLQLHELLAYLAGAACSR